MYVQFHEESAKDFAQKWNIPKYTTSMKEAIEDPETDIVIVALPNYLHKEAILMACKAKKTCSMYKTSCIECC